MKQFLQIALATMVASAFTNSELRAQLAVPNGTLETWVVRGGSDAPTQWQTTDDVLRLVAPFPTTGAVTKSTDFHGGSFSARLANSPTLLGNVPGFLVLGSNLSNYLSVDSLVQLGGLPYTSRAARMQFYYKFAGTIASPDDRPLVRVQLTKTTAGVRQVVATGYRYLTAATTYTLMDFPLSYKLGIAPDSVHIAFGSADFDGGNFTPGNTLFVDDITLTGLVTATRDAQLPAAVEAYPNPSTSGVFSLLSPHDNSLLSAAFTVTDALGRVVLRQAATPASPPATRTVDLRQQPAGVYSLCLDTPRGVLVKKLLIK